MAVEGMLSIAECSDLIGVPRGTISYWCHEGFLAVARWHRGRRYFSPEAVKACQAARLAKPNRKGLPNHGSVTYTAPEKARQLPPEPTDTIPGTPERMAVYAQRDEANYLLFHPDDLKLHNESWLNHGSSFFRNHREVA